ncbi:MAG TPA: thioredoxin domain-containing protein [Edaphobacter sp.]|uniref:thioredoxin domain-containing protein n=1 Tax=Edaphobacter sp. TaxID=1934404 RepID=UPI002C73854F|nr:thioredoxin domain-containing protein [Edaphobacter sp.]HUZ93416.1 thioredoxin domain-containing protein [Edaphobacter sp.]
MSEKKNSLERAASAYLRSAMHQPVDWQQWGPEAFALAQAEDKPILLDIGAVWCHWCHVMDRESYENAETAKVINEHFIPVKVDRDERPDVDTRYQAAVSSISGQGGWPLTAFLTPDGKPYFGGTYFPPQDQHGRPGFQRVLLTMAEAFEKQRDQVNESAASVIAAIEHNESFMGRAGNPGPELVQKLVDSAVKQFDPRSGGFGSQPKFPHSGAIDLLLDTASRGGGNEAAKTAAMVTLQKMAQGGIYDHLAGGFHRYSVDEGWVVPHFEKMAYDNSELLKNYVHAFQTFAEPESARVAREMILWIDEWLSDREQGGFYASQDADFSLEDDGDYFTWTRDEAAAVLSAEEMAIAGAYYDIGEIGDMHHDPLKNVLHIRVTLEEVARANGVTVEVARERLASAKKKLYAARLERPTPYVDKTVYVAWNGMMISAYLEAGRVLDLPEAKAFALKSLDRLLHEAWDAGKGMAHVVAYGEEGGSAARVAGVLDDYVFVGHAALDAWEATGEMRYYLAAERIAASAVARFYDKTGLAFFDTEAPAEGEVRLGALVTRRKPLQDSPTPAANPVAAALLLRLAALNDREEYAVMALETLETFAGVVEHFGLYAASYGLALQRLLLGTVQVCVIGDDDEARRLEAVALARYAVNKSVVRLRRDQLSALPPALAETLPHLPGIDDSVDGSVAVICTGRGCLPPVRTVEALIAAMNQAL